MRCKLLLILAAAFVLSNCSKDTLSPNPETDHATQNDPLTPEDINASIYKSLETKGDFRWDNVSDHFLWSAVVQSDSIVAVGYKPAAEGNINSRMHLIDINDPEWKAAKEKIIQLIVSETNKAFPGRNYTAGDLLAFDEQEVLPLINIRVFNEQVISKLRSLPEVRYVDAIGYIIEEELNFRSDSGCGNPTDNNIPGADFTSYSPDVIVPWNFFNMSIPQAWNTSTGDGIGVAVIDTGTSPNQSKLGSQFNSGQSQGRSISKTGTYVSSWWPWANPDGPNDGCGHGTRMAGLISAPRGYNDATVGVAYNCDLLAIRAVDDVVIWGSRETNGVSDALVIAGGSSIKVISMSIGSLFWNNQIADAVYYAYGNGKMLFAAAGTSTWFTSWVGVVFPATMNETFAVTGVKDGSSLQKCNSCHSGSAVDFVAVMERQNDGNRTSLTLSNSGNVPSRIGGSSAATATTAGIAALVWGSNPSMSRAQVLQKMQNASQFYPGRNSEFGWGLINANQAVN